MTRSVFSHKLKSGASAAAVLVASAAPALALTPEELWGQWQEFLASSGYEVSVETGGSGDTLVLDNLTLTMPIRAEDQVGTITANLGQYTLSEEGDGAVRVTMPESQPIVVDIAAEGEDPLQVTLEQTATAFEMLAEGTLEDTRYGFSADSYGLGLTSITEAGDPVDLGTAVMEVTSVAGTTSIKTDSAYEVEQEFTAEALSYDLAFSEPADEGQGRVAASGTMTGIRSTGGGTLPIGVDTQDFAALVAAGYDVSGALSYQGGEGEMMFNDGDQSLEVKTSSGGGQYTFGLDGARLTYQALGQQVALDISGSEMPLPLNLMAEEIGFQTSVPLAETEEAESFEIGLTLTEVSLPDQLWAQADPQGGLPHDPLTVQLSLSGTGRLFVDLTDEEEMQQLAETGGTPGEIETLTLDNLTIKGLGAEIGATADLTVDNEATSPFGPGPNVYGTANVHLVGVQGLLNTLSQLGMVPPAQAMMMAGMISQLGRPVSGPDDLEADIEMSPDGSLTINGAPMPLR